MRRFIQSLAALLCCSGLLAACSNNEEISFPTVLRVARTIPSDSGAEYDDYERMGALVDGLVKQLQSVDSSIRIQTALYGRRNFVDEIQRQTNSGFGPDLIITDSETTLELYSRNLIHPIGSDAKGRDNIPAYIFNLARAKDGQLVGQPVSQYVQLACYNKEKVKTPPDSLIDLPKDNDDLTFGLALQLKDLYWTAEAFQAEQAIEIAMQGQQPTKEQAQKVSTWLTWLKTASYQQNIRFLNDQNRLRRALIAGELDWITCWSTNLPELRETMKDKLGVVGIPKGPSKKLRAMTRLSVWSLGRNSSSGQREKALTFIDFITKPWAQKTYALRNKTSFPVDKNAARIVASKIPGGLSALSQYEEQAIKVSAAASRTKAMVFRDPERYDTISDHLLDTIYDIETPEEASQNILTALQEEKQ
ncbi:extracellular solute-binding protein [Synechococcus sp. KORDI-100]|uniref:extracellular solute-binding protein n=1 Tax=Synechococcus sp. KORDI-100 TaxID=1280380 RepID=UPI000570890B|nr:extracellular solute-binding protein [Synechococcus sp. KORDI-100]